MPTKIGNPKWYVDPDIPDNVAFVFDPDMFEIHVYPDGKRKIYFNPKPKSSTTSSDKKSQ